MEQNTIAIIWDFDKTLTPGYMQDPLFKKFGVNSHAFWAEVNSLPEKYRKQGIKANKDTIYLNHIITCVEQGLFPGLNQQMLTELGAEIEFYDGVPEIFKTLKALVEGEEKYRRHSIHVEHYVVSTGITAMINGSKVSEYIDGVWGCEFIEIPIESSLPGANRLNRTDSIVRQTGYIIDNTSKTRAVFEINKGANKLPQVDVNSKMNHADRRVPFSNMIYIADGPSDVPVFSVIKQYGGKAYAVYSTKNPEKRREGFTQANDLLRDGRIDMYGEANYSEGSAAHEWLSMTVTDIADAIFHRIEARINESVSQPPEHIH